MVNPGKRMRRLIPQLLNVRNGPGAAILPSPPAPQLTSIRMRFPRGPFEKDKGHNMLNSDIHGARVFWRTYLRQFKYHNLTVPVHVEHAEDAWKGDVWISLQYEAPTREALKAIDVAADAPSFHNPGLKSNKGSSGDSADTNTEVSRQDPSFRRTSSLNSSETGSQLVKDELVEKPKPTAGAAVTTSSPQESTTTTYMRTVSLGLRGRTAAEIWQWLEKGAKPKPVPESQEDIEARATQEELARSGEVDRQRVKKGIDAMRREQEDLKRAREAADRLAAEAL